jgi:hypothetical protein
MQGNVMTNEDTRLARLRRECDFSAGPVWLLAAACAVLLLMLGLNALLGETASTRVDGTSLNVHAPESS